MAQPRFVVAQQEVECALAGVEEVVHLLERHVRAGRRVGPAGLAGAGRIAQALRVADALRVDGQPDHAELGQGAGFVGDAALVADPAAGRDGDHCRDAAQAGQVLRPVERASQHRARAAGREVHDHRLVLVVPGVRRLVVAGDHAGARHRQRRRLHRGGRGRRRHDRDRCRGDPQPASHGTNTTRPTA